MNKHERGLSVKAHELMCVLCWLGGAEADAQIDEIVQEVRKNPSVPIRVECDAAESPYRYAGASSEAEPVDRKRDMDVLQRLGFVPGSVRPALELFERLLKAIETTAGICLYDEETSPAWRSCPQAQAGHYEKARAQGIAAVIPKRSAEEKARVKRESVAEMYAADTLRIRPHHLLCMTCFHRGRETLTPIEEDNLCEAIDIIRKNPDVPVTLVRGCCMICPPCSSYHAESGLCLGGNGRALRDEKKDLDVLQKLGLSFDDTLPAHELLTRLFDRIRSTRDVCGYGDGVVRGPEWTICGGPDGSEGYIKGRKAGLGIKEIVVE